MNNWVSHLLWTHLMFFKCSFVGQNQHCFQVFFLILIFSANLLLLKVFVSFRIHPVFLLVRADLQFWKDNPSVHTHVQCLCVRDECPWSVWVKDFVTNMLPHTSIWLNTTISKRSERRRQFLIYLSCLDSGSCVSVFKCIWAGLFHVFVWVFCVLIYCKWC